MNDSERAALVEALAEAMMPNAFSHAARAMIRQKATACLPIIDRLMAAHDLDALERGYDEGYGMRSLERTGTWRTLGENTDER